MRVPLIRLICLLSLITAIPSHALTLTFDNLATDTCCNEVPNGYGGLTWQNVNYINGRDYNPNNPNPPPSGNYNGGYNNGRVSGAFVAYNAYGREATVRGSSFDFTSIYLTAAWNTGLNVRVRGLSSGNVLYDNTVVVNSDAPTLFNFNYLGVDQLIFDSFGGVNAGYSTSGTQFVMDNMTINPVPEPSTGVLLIAGLLGVSVRRASCAQRAAARSHAHRRCPGERPRRRQDLASGREVPVAGDVHITVAKERSEGTMRGPDEGPCRDGLVGGRRRMASATSTRRFEGPSTERHSPFPVRQFDSLLSRINSLFGQKNSLFLRREFSRKCPKVRAESGLEVA